MAGQIGFWDIEHRLAELSAEGDPLETLSQTVDFEVFRPILERAVRRRSAPSKGGWPGFDVVLKFKMLVLQSRHGLALGRTAYLVRDRLSWMRFCGLGPGDAVPDANTLWDFREALIAAGAFDDLFQRLDRAISEAGYLPMSGQIVDATLVSAPRQRNTEVEKQAIKEGKVPEAWRDKPAKLRQKDRDARWTVKFFKGKTKADGTPQGDIAIPHFGYKNHVSIDRKLGIIRRAIVTDAAAADGARLRRVGRQRLPLRGQRGVPRRSRQGQSHPPQEAEGQTDASGDRQGQRGEIQDPFPGRACLRRDEGPDGAGHPDHWPRPRQGNDHVGQHGLQHEALVLARPSGRDRLSQRPNGAIVPVPGSLSPAPYHPTRQNQ